MGAAGPVMQGTVKQAREVLQKLGAVGAGACSATLINTDGGPRDQDGAFHRKMSTVGSTGSSSSGKVPLLTVFNRSIDLSWPSPFYET